LLYEDYSLRAEFLYLCWSKTYLHFQVFLSPLLKLLALRTHSRHESFSKYWNYTVYHTKFYNVKGVGIKFHTKKYTWQLFWSLLLWVRLPCYSEDIISVSKDLISLHYPSIELNLRNTCHIWIHIINGNYIFRDLNDFCLLL